MILKLIRWFFSPSIKPNFDGYNDVYQRLIDLEERVKLLEEENIETTNELYRMENSLDARIDILAERCRIDYDV